MLSSGRKVYRRFEKYLPYMPWVVKKNYLARPFPPMDGRYPGIKPLMRKRRPVRSYKPRRKTLYKKRRPVTSKMALSARVNKLEKKQKDMLSLLIYKIDAKDNLRPGVGQALYGYITAISTAQIEAALATCRFFDPATPGTPITASLASPTYTQRVSVAAYSQVIIKNNYQVPCVVTCGVVRPKVDTSTTPNQALTNGWTDCGNPDSGSTLISYIDSKEFRELWSGKLKSYKIMPGRQIIIKTGAKQFDYDPSYTDTESETFTKRNRSAVYTYRCQGVLGHDTAVSTEQGMLSAGIDVYASTTYFIRYNSGGAALKTIVLSEGASQSFTNSGVVSSMPVADNVIYSVS